MVLNILSEAKPKAILRGSRYKRNSLNCLSVNDLIGTLRSNDATGMRTSLKK